MIMLKAPYRRSCRILGLHRRRIVGADLIYEVYEEIVSGLGLKLINGHRDGLEV